MGLAAVSVQPARSSIFDYAGNRAIQTVFGATLGMATGFGCLALPSVFMQPLQAEFGFTKSALSLCYTMAAFGMASAGIIWGRLSDRVDIRYLLVFGGCFIVLPFLIMWQATELWHFYAANIILGTAGFGCLYALLLSATGDWFDSRRGLVVGIVTAGGAIGQGILPYVAEKLINNFGWRDAFLAIGAAMFVAQFTIAITVRRPAPSQAAGNTAATGHSVNVWSFPSLRLLAFAAFLCCACMGVPLIHLTGYISAVCGSSSLGATSLLVAMICGAVGRVCFGLAADRFGSLVCYASASLVQTVCIIIFPLIVAQAPLMALSAIFGFGFAGNMTCLILCVRQEVPPSQFGSAIGLVMFIAWIGMGVGGYIGGAFYDQTGGYTLSFLGAAGFGFAHLAVLGALAAIARPLSFPKIPTGQDFHSWAK